MTPTHLPLDTIAEYFEKICDLSAARPFPNAFAAVAAAMRNVLRNLKNK
ncbi:MAG: hypothetical protein AB9Q23_06240 [Candidatus Reddybacter sp.]